MTNPDFTVVDAYCPDYIIAVRTLSQPNDIYSFCYRHNLETYTYGIFHKNNILKYGCSHPAMEDRKNTDTFGERIVRQLAKAPGWTEQFYNPQNKTYSGVFEVDYGWVAESENGQDFKDIIEEYQSLYGLKVDKNDLYVHIWNLTYIDSLQFPFSDDDQGRKDKALYFEGLLVDQYKLDNMGNAPFGNQKKDPSLKNKIYTRPKITYSVAELFSGI